MRTAAAGGYGVTSTTCGSSTLTWLAYSEFRYAT